MRAKRKTVKRKAYKVKAKKIRTVRAKSWKFSFKGFLRAFNLKF